MLKASLDPSAHSSGASPQSVQSAQGALSQTHRACPAIVIPAFNRPEALARLLRSIAIAHYPPDTQIPLHFSLEGGATPEVHAIAHNFPWSHGPKHIEIHPTRLGLRAHIHHCGGLTDRYGSIILLEDDLIVAPSFYTYTAAVLPAAEGKDEIAGIALYSYALTENTHLPFYPEPDPDNVYRLQLPCSWGQAWTAKHWAAYQAWHDTASFDDANPTRHRLPRYIADWGAQSWKKQFAAYLIETNKYFLYPARSLTTNPSEAGTHATTPGLFQVPLDVGEREWYFDNLQFVAPAYDPFFEPHPDWVRLRCPDLRTTLFDVDLYGAKDPEWLKSPFVLTTRKATTAQKRYGMDLLPPIANIQHTTPGHAIAMAPREALDLTPVRPSDWLQLLQGPIAQALDTVAPHSRVTFSIAIPLPPGTAPANIDWPGLAAFPRTEVIVVTEEGHPPTLPPSAQEFTHRILQVAQGTGDITALHAAFAVATGTVFGFLMPGQRLHPTALAEVATIFNRFPDIDWLLCATPPEPMRWDKPSFLRKTKYPPHFQPGTVFFRKSLYQKASGPTAQTYYNLWTKFFDHTTPTTADLETTFRHAEATAEASHSINKTSASLRAILATLTRPAYHRNIRILRQLHLWLSRYAPLLRQAPNGDWFKSEF